MNESDPKSFPFPTEWFAGYADGELAPEERALVESFLADHPETQADLELQSFFTAGNEEFVRRVSPPTVSEGDWSRVFANIEMALDSIPSDVPVQPHQSTRGWRSWTTVAALTVTLAGLLFLLLPTNLIPVTQGIARYPGLDEEIRVASADEVEIYSLDESAASGLVVGRHPLSVTPFVLASFEEVDLRGVEPDSQGEYPELQMTPPGAATPMIWAKLALSPK